MPGRRKILQLLILRHAKAESNRPGSRDFDRALDARGLHDASAIGRELKNRGQGPELALCSPALRTRQTLALANAMLGIDWNQRFVDKLYEADLNDVFDCIHKFGANASPLLVVGHNPVLQHFALAIASPKTDHGIEMIASKFPTAALAAFEVPISDWSELGPNTARLDAYLPPRELA